MVPGEIFAAPGEIVLNNDSQAISLKVANTGDRPIQVGSHYHFAETNAALSFDRGAALGYRLDIPAGTAVRFEPGQSRDVLLVPYAGARLVYGFHQAVYGTVAGRAVELKVVETEVIGNASQNESKRLRANVRPDGRR